MVAIWDKSCGCCESCTMVAAGVGGASSAADDVFSVLRWGWTLSCERSGERTEDDYYGAAAVCLRDAARAARARPQRKGNPLTHDARIINSHQPRRLLPTARSSLITVGVLHQLRCVFGLRLEIWQQLSFPCCEAYFWFHSRNFWNFWLWKEQRVR
jgi:hypothetical protein